MTVSLMYIDEDDCYAAINIQGRDFSTPTGDVDPLSF